jgi:hypothetical protein
MPSLSKTTKDHEEIRRWAEERGGKPAHVKSTGSGEDIGILRIDFPGYSGAGSLEPITWEQWFEKFDERGLALLYQETTAGGQRSNFNKIVSSETAEEAVNGRAETRSRAKKKTASKKSSRSRISATKTAGRSAARRAGGASKKATKAGGGRRAASRTSGAKKTSSRSATSKKSTGKKTATKRRR